MVTASDENLISSSVIKWFRNAIEADFLYSSLTPLSLLSLYDWVLHFLLMLSSTSTSLARVNDSCYHIGWCISIIHFNSFKVSFNSFTSLITLARSLSIPCSFLVRPVVYDKIFLTITTITIIYVASIILTINIFCNCFNSC